MVEFPVSGVETYWWLPAVVAFVISTLTSTGGVSGAFLLLPFQVSVLGFAGPAVSPTNLIFNIVAIPGGVYRYQREKRVVWSLAWTIIATTLPGLLIGAIIRIKYLPDPRSFKLFAAFVLLYLGVRLCIDIFRKTTAPKPIVNDGRFEVSSQSMGLKEVSYEFNGERYRIPTWQLFLLSFIVGIVGGVYGIGGGAIIAPFLVAVFRLPVHSVAGACLFGTFVSSIGGVLIYAGLGWLMASEGPSIAPDWLLGLSFGIGGMAGMYLGARLQRFMPPRLIKSILAAAVIFVVIKYAVEFFG